MMILQGLASALPRGLVTSARRAPWFVGLIRNPSYFDYGVVTLVVYALCLAVHATAVRGQNNRPPNVVLVMTDDQGYGDIGALGNSMIQTPHLDRLYADSIRLTDFHVDPTCSPTRSALLTGRYSTRTGVWHTIMGRSLMRPDELTLAEVFRSAGYRTGMFGKWHLGDNYPLRPQDQGFDEVVCHGGGGVGQGPDYWDNDYFDDTYWRNGRPEKFSGYCTDVWFDEAMKFIEAHRDEPFFVYLATNAPHGPLNVAEEYSRPYVDKGVSASMAKFYGMITNIDDNMGRLLNQLDRLKLADNTILIFMTDNGTATGVGGVRKQQSRGAWTGFNAGMRGQKGSEYDGGHRVPFFIRWPAGMLAGGRDVDQLTAHIDVLPTLVDLCSIRKPDGPPLDGASLVSILRGDTQALRDRTLFVHSQRVHYPRKWRKSAVMTSRWRLINGQELYDIRSDPGQQHDVAGDHSEVVQSLRKAYEQWWDSLSSVFDQPVRIGLGSAAEPRTLLHPHDWLVTTQDQSAWHQDHVRRGDLKNGPWEVDVTRAGQYQIELRRWPEQINGPIEAVRGRIRIGPVDVSKKVSPEDTRAVFQMELPAGPAELQTYFTLPDGRERGAYFVYVTRLGDR